MKILIVGLGVQGKKRKKLLSKNFFFGSVDKKRKDADFAKIEDVPLKKYDSVFICTPDSEKLKILKYCIKHNKHMLVEKPLIANSNIKITELEKKANKAKLVLYTAYNHRFEPHFKKIKQIIDSKILGKIYYCHILYGNGTANLVKKNKWRDKGLGVIQDLGPHLIDTIKFWFKKDFQFKSLVKNRFENKSPDHGIFYLKKKKFFLKLEMSLCMWKNTFRCDIIGSKGSVHMDGLCKWGPSLLRLLKRKFPSGLPQEKKYLIKSKDPTWVEEHQHFFNLVKLKKKNDLSKDKWINKSLRKIVI